MDNLTFRISNLGYDVPTLLSALEARDINVTQKSIARPKTKLILFSVPVGRFAARWLFRLNLTDRSVSCSGGVTKTFFGHNLWVFNNECDQLCAITEIVSARLAEIDGIALPDSLLDAITVERVELTNHFILPPPWTHWDAIGQANSLFMVLFPKLHDPDGKTVDDPGTASIGKNKSSKVCRVYDPCKKFKDRPVHVTPESWATLTSECANHLRVEVMMMPRDVKRLKLEHVDAWQDTAKIADYLAKKHKHFGLTVDYKAEAGALTPAAVKKTNPTFVEYARYWFSDGERGTAPNKTSGSANRFRQYMEERGFNINVPLKHHVHLTHGMHEFLDPALRADIPQEVRANKELFGQWWNEK